MMVIITIIVVEEYLNSTFNREKNPSHSTLPSKGNEKLVPTLCPRAQDLNKRDERGFSRQSCWNESGQVLCPCYISGMPFEKRLLFFGQLAG